MDQNLSFERELFEQAVALPAAERDLFLERHCPDASLRARVAALLRSHDSAGESFLARSAGELAAAAIGRAGRRLGAYRIVRELGHGGMGAVYLATRADDEFEKQVAIKIVAAPLGDEELVRRFRRERQILAELEHPLIARLLDGGTTEDGLPFLVMEFVDGRRIDDYCRDRKLDTRERLRLFVDVCDAVQFAHANLVVHRDLKPQNILVAGDGRPRLLDFGVATLVGQAEGSDGFTQTASYAMTPAYASPEQLRGGRIGTATDIYSLGVVLYELLTGSRPHELSGLSPEEVSRAVETPPARPSVTATRRGDKPLARRLTGDLDAIVLTAVRTDPARRYGSVAALADDIRRHLSGQPVSARGDSIAYRLGTFTRRHRLAAAAGVLVLATLITGMVATARQARIADEQRREAERQRASAERRFAEVRQLANAFLFEFHDAIAALPGATPARHLVVSKGLEYLDRLASESAGDPTLQRELAAAYDKVGDVQGNPSVANLGDASAALASYRKAEAIRRRITAESPQNLDARLELSISVMKIADGLVGRGAVKEAILLYHEALEAREAALKEGRPSTDAAHRAVVEASGRLCTTLLATGDAKGALDNCRRNRAVADARLAANPGDAAMRVHRATSGVALGNALRITRQPAEAEAALTDAIGRCLELLEANPAQADVRRRLAIAYGYLANVQLDLAQPQRAARNFELAVAALSQLHTADPSNARTAPELAYMLNQRAKVLMSLQQRDAARREAARAIALSRAAAERAGAGGDTLNEYAWALVTAEPAELRNPAQAESYARRAIERAGTPNPVYLHTLATAQHQLGQRGQAVATLEEALQLMPAAPTGGALGIRKQIETDLARFKGEIERPRQ